MSAHNKHHSFDTLIDVSRERADKARVGLGQAITGRQGAEQQLATLQDYRSDYAARLRAATERGITASNYHNFTRFLATLDQAILQQTKVVAQWDNTARRNKDAWQSAQQRLQAFQTLHARLEQSQAMAKNRQEQLMNDELSNTVHRRARAQRGQS